MGNFRKNSVLLGAIIGDMLGSAYEYPAAVRTTDINFPAYPKGSRFTDDSVTTVAKAKFLLALVKGDRKRDLASVIKDFVIRYPNRGYGEKFQAWCKGSNDTDSFGNGAAMRISPVAYVAQDRNELAYLVKETTSVTHTNQLALDYALATAIAIYEAAKGSTMLEIQKAVDAHLSECKAPGISHFGSYGSAYTADVPVSKSFPSVAQALACFFYTKDAEMAMRQAVACGRDPDTQASIAGVIGLTYYCQLPSYLVEKAPDLPTEFLDIIDEFSDRFRVPSFNII